MQIEHIISLSPLHAAAPSFPPFPQHLSVVEMAIALQRCSGLPALRARPAVAARPARVMVCKASKSDTDKAIATLAVPVATVVAAGMLFSAVVPEQALAARSGGRAGGSNFAARRAPS